MQPPGARDATLCCGVRRLKELMAALLFFFFLHQLGILAFGFRSQARNFHVCFVLAPSFDAGVGGMAVLS